MIKLHFLWIITWQLIIIRFCKIKITNILLETVHKWRFSIMGISGPPSLVSIADPLFFGKKGKEMLEARKHPNNGHSKLILFISLVMYLGFQIYIPKMYFSPIQNIMLDWLDPEASGLAQHQRWHRQGSHPLLTLSPLTPLPPLRVCQ